MQIEMTILTFEQIFSKLDKREYVIVHIKDTMVPALLEPDSGKLFEVPDGYLEYDAKHFWRNI